MLAYAYASYTFRGTTQATVHKNVLHFISHGTSWRWNEVAARRTNWRRRNERKKRTRKKKQRHTESVICALRSTRWRERILIFFFFHSSSCRWCCCWSCFFNFEAIFFFPFMLQSVSILWGARPTHVHMQYNICTYLCFARIYCSM